MASGYSFRPRGWALALAVASCVAFIALGNWQARRAEEKRALGAQLETNRIALDGTFLPDYTVFLDNKIRNHRAGYEVVTPLRVDGDQVLVNRGWIEARPRRDVLPQVRTPAGQVHVEKPVVSAENWNQVQRADLPRGRMAPAAMPAISAPAPGMARACPD